MNRKMILNVIGRLLMLEGMLMILPVIVGLYYRENINSIGSFLISGGILIIAGLLMNIRKTQIRTFYASEGMVIVALSWILMGFFGGLPLYFSGQYPSLIDSFFEISSGLTTTGATVCTNVEALSRSILFWRSFTHLIGGMGVLVFALAIMPQMKEDGVYLMKAEVPGPVFGKIVSKMGDTARILYIIYLAMTAVLTLLLYLAGMPFFDSMIHAFGAAGTGGFGIKNNSIAYYNSVPVEIILGIGMISFGVNFNLYYLVLRGKIKEFFKSEELRLYLGILAAAIILITINTGLQYKDPARALRDSFFTASSIMTTTGYSTADFNTWPLFSHIILLVLMFVGGSAGSTAGGLKVSRIGTLFKSAVSEIKRTRNPRRVINFRFEGKDVNQTLMRSVFNYLILYILFFLALVIIVSLDVQNFVSAFSAVAATFNNIGPGLDVVGPTSSYASMGDFTKFALSIGMIAGRLEILPVLILLSPSTWKKI